MSLSSSIFIAVITAIVTANVSISKFKRERIWEKQAESYSRILFGITTASEYSNAFIETYRFAWDGEPATRSQELSVEECLKKRKKAENDLKELSAKYHFFLSENTRNILDRFHKGIEWEDWMDSDELAETDLENLTTLEKEIKQEAAINISPAPSNVWKIAKAISQYLDSKLLGLRVWVESWAK